MNVRPKQNGLIRPRNAPGQTGVVNLLHHGAGFFLVVREGVQSNFCPWPFVRPELFAAPARVAFDDGVGRRENSVGRTIILFQLDDFDLGEMFLQLEQVGNLRAAPSVNALVIVAHDAQVAVLASQRVDQVKLGGVGVLVFIHHHVMILFPACSERVGVLREKPERQQNQIIEIDGVASV